MDYSVGIIICSIIFILSLCLLKKDKILSFMNSLKWKKKSKTTKNRKKSKDNEKFKIAETQIRPILLPPSKSKPQLKEPEGKPLLTAPKLENEVDKNMVSNQNLFDFGSSMTINKNNSASQNTLQTVNINQNAPQYSNINQINELNQFGKANLNSSFNFSNNIVKPNSLPKDRFNFSPNKYKTKEELNKEFENVKKFIDATNINSNLAKKNLDNDNLKSNAFQNFSAYNKSDFTNTNLINNNFEKEKASNDIFSRANQIREEFPQYSKEEEQKNIVKVDDEEIDLNKLPSNLKRLLIADILSRKKFD